MTDWRLSGCSLPAANPGSGCVHVCVWGGHLSRVSGRGAPLSRNPAPLSSWQRLPPPGAPTFQQVLEPELPPPPVPPAPRRPCLGSAPPSGRGAAPCRALRTWRCLSSLLLPTSESPESPTLLPQSTCFLRKAGSWSLLRSRGHGGSGPRRRRFRGGTPTPVLQKGGSKAEGSPRSQEPQVYRSLLQAANLLQPLYRLHLVREEGWGPAGGHWELRFVSHKG